MRFHERKVTTSEGRQLPKQQLRYEKPCDLVMCLLEITSAFYYSAFHLRPYLSEELKFHALLPSLQGRDTTSSFVDPALTGTKKPKQINRILQ